MENVKPLYVNFIAFSKTPQELVTAIELLIFEMLSDLQIDNKDAANIYEDILEDFIHCKEKREFFVNWAKETKNINLKFIWGQEFFDKYGFKCPTGVKGRNSDNKLFKEKIGWETSQPLFEGMLSTFNWMKTKF